jgi:epoxide hydrolase 4
VAVDLRGYNDSDKPAGVANYEAEVLVADIIELIEVLGAFLETKYPTNL